MFDNIKEPLPNSVKILNFKAGIHPEAGLESALDVARGLPSVGNNFDNFMNNITEGVINRHSRREMFRSTSNTREVAAYGGGGRCHGGRGRGRERGRGGRGRDRSMVMSRRATNIPDKIVIDGKELYPFKSYSNNEYQELNSNQRNKLRKARLKIVPIAWIIDPLVPLSVKAFAKHLVPIMNLPLQLMLKVIWILYQPKNMMKQT